MPPIQLDNKYEQVFQDNDRIHLMYDNETGITVKWNGEELFIDYHVRTSKGWAHTTIDQDAVLVIATLMKKGLIQIND